MFLGSNLNMMMPRFGQFQLGQYGMPGMAQGMQPGMQPGMFRSPLANYRPNVQPQAPLQGLLSQAAPVRQGLLRGADGGDKSGGRGAADRGRAGMSGRDRGNFGH